MKRQGNVASLAESLLQPAKTPEVFFQMVQGALIASLRERGYLPGNLKSVALGETVVMIVAADRSPPEAISEAADLLSRLRLALTPDDEARIRAAKRHLGVRAIVPTAADLVAIGVRLRSFLEGGKPRSSGAEYSSALSYYLWFTRCNGGVEPTSSQMFEEIRPTADVENFKKTYRGWRRKWRSLELAMDLAHFDNLDGS